MIKANGKKKSNSYKWQFNYNVTKRRGGTAPEGSGVPVGTEYHWYILANQNVKKLDANNYTTSMIGFKYDWYIKDQIRTIGARQIMHRRKDCHISRIDRTVEKRDE